VLDVSDDDAMRILARMSRGCYAKNGPVELKLNRAQEWQLGMSVNKCCVLLHMQWIL